MVPCEGTVYFYQQRRCQKCTGADIKNQANECVKLALQKWRLDVIVNNNYHSPNVTAK
jgi:hypothetical protein